MLNRRLGLCVAVGVITIPLVACTAPGPDARWTHVEGAPVRGDTSRKCLALIFTGGEHGEGTAHILDVLRAADIRASFFVTGDYLAVPGYPDLVRRMIAEGHYVGPHSHSHPLYCAWEDRAQTLVTEEFFRDDLERNIADLRELGALPAGEPLYFIPPYEWYNAEQVAWADAMCIVLFNFTSGSGSNRDWIPEGQAKFVSSQAILDGILEYEQRDPHGLNGFLLLLHLGAQRADKMHMQLEPLIDELRRRGYKFARVDEMLVQDGRSRSHRGKSR
ncbi:MAG: polysaccharide deacetylase family protein [Phycisphaerae bacterium]|nr:polysaccharide deacetylase family protein [Phycisphaerae bacterium]